MGGGAARTDEREGKALALRRLDGVRQGRRRIAFRTSALTSRSTVVVHFVIANSLAHMEPWSRAARSLKPRVASWLMLRPASTLSSRTPRQPFTARVAGPSKAR